MATGREVATRTYREGDIIVPQGGQGNCMYLIRAGQVEVIRTEGKKEFCLSELGPGGFFGEMSLFDNSGYPAMVRALSEVAIEAIDRDEFVRRVKQDPAWALSVVEHLARRARRSDEVLVQIADVKASISYL